MTLQRTQDRDWLPEALWLAFRLAAESILMVDAAGRVFFANPAFLRLTGYNEAAIDSGMAMPWFESSEQLFAMWPSLARGEHWTGKLKLRCADGSRLEVEATVAPLFDDTGQMRGYLQMLRDLTQQARLEAQLLHAQKMEAVGRLAGGVAHDFNNLLTVINGHTDLLLRRNRENEHLRRDLLEIRKAGESAAALTRQLLAFSRRQRLQPKLIDPNQLLADLEKMLRRLIGEHVELELCLTPDALRVFADPGQFEQVVMNLVVNARDAMPGGGRITLETRAATLAEPQARGEVVIPAGGYCVLTVRDTGVGINAEVMDHIFEPFFTTKEAGKGTGLGLSTVYGIVHQSGGCVVVESEPNIGSTFLIYLPVASAERAETAAEAVAEPLRHRGETILIVEDDVMVRTLLRDLLSLHGYQIYEAANGREALDFCIRQNCKIDLIMTDVIMPQMNGFEFAEELVHVRPQTRVLFMSGYTDEMVNESGLSITEVNYLQKPFSTTMVESKVREILDQPIVAD